MTRPNKLTPFLMAALLLTACQRQSDAPPGQPVADAQPKPAGRSAAGPAGAVSRPVPVAAGTHLQVQITKTLSSKDAITGQQVDFTVVDDVPTDGQVAIQRGARAWGYVTKAVSQKLKRSGSLEFTIESVKGADGEDIALTAAHRVAADGGLIRGKEVTIDAGTAFAATVAATKPSSASGGDRSGLAGGSSSSGSPTGSASGRFFIYISAPERDGFLDTSKDIQDSIKDLRNQFGKQKDVSVALTDEKSRAQVILTVVQRGVGSQAFGQRVSFQRYYGGAELVSQPVVANTFWLSTVLEIGKYKKEFTGTWVQESRDSMGAWTLIAGDVARNVASWLTANRDAITRNKK